MYPMHGSVRHSSHNRYFMRSTPLNDCRCDWPAPHPIQLSINDEFFDAMKHSIALLPIVVAAMILAGCGDAPVQNDPDASRLKGTLAGRSMLEDYGMKDVSSFAGIAVRLDGTSFHTITDSSGYWQFDSVPAGIYTISFAKEGFSPYKIFDQQFVGGGRLLLATYRPTLLRIPQYSVSNFQLDSITAAGDGSSSLAFSGTFSPDTLPAGITPFLIVTKDSSYDATISVDEYSGDSYSQQLQVATGRGAIKQGPGLTTATLLSSGLFERGDTVYLAAHIRNNGGGGQHAGGYYDPYQQKMVYPAVGTTSTNVVRYIVP
jgi:hypothetical protein